MSLTFNAFFSLSVHLNLVFSNQFDVSIFSFLQFLFNVCNFKCTFSQNGSKIVCCCSGWSTTVVLHMALSFKICDPGAQNQS